MEPETKDSLKPTPKYNAFGFVEGYVCPQCGGSVSEDHSDDVGTVFYRCEKCRAQTARPKSAEKEAFIKRMKDSMAPMTLDTLSEILGSTIKHDTHNKIIVFLGMLLTYTEEDQTNISFTAESSSGKSYIPLELAWYFPPEDVLEYSYVSPTAFFHEYGIPLADPNDTRDVEEEKKHKIIHIDLHQKILVFIDQPHDMLLQRLRPLLSHDRKTLAIKITDRRERSGLRTKTVLIEGYPTVLFCSAKFSMEEQERTRLLLLSPETHQDKLKDAILLKIQKDSDRQAFSKFMEEDLKRVWLRERVQSIRTAAVKQVIISEDLQSRIADRFFEKHRSLIPRHQRDIGRLIGLIKANALLNLWDRQRENDTVFVNSNDVDEGFRLYERVSLANELGLPPEVFNVFMQLRPKIGEPGVSRKEFQTLYYQTFHRTLGKKRLDEIVSLLESVGLLIEEPDPNDKRIKRLCLPTGPGVFSFERLSNHSNGSTTDGKLNTPEGVGSTNIGKISLDDLVSVHWADSLYAEHECGVCGHKAMTTWRGDTVSGAVIPVCESCKTEYEKRRQAS